MPARLNDSRSIGIDETLIDSVRMEYYAPDVNVTGVTELVGNALILPGEKERETDLRQEPLPGMEEE